MRPQLTARRVSGDNQRMNVHWLNAWLEVVEHAVTCGAIVLGGFASYYRFFKGRIYGLRYEPKVSGTIWQRDGATYVSINASVKNIGVSPAVIEAGTGLRLYTPEDMGQVRSVLSMSWNTPQEFFVFRKKEILEAGEIAEESKLIILPGEGYRAIKVELLVNSSPNGWLSHKPRKGDKDVREWITSSIILNDR